MTVLLVAGVVGLWLYAVVRVLNLTGPALPPTLTTAHHNIIGT